MNLFVINNKYVLKFIQIQQCIIFATFNLNMLLYCSLLNYFNYKKSKKKIFYLNIFKSYY